MCQKVWNQFDILLGLIWCPSCLQSETIAGNLKLSCKPNIYLSSSSSKIRVRLEPSNIFKPSSNCFTDFSKVDPFCYLCFVFVYHTVLSVPCSLVVTCWERADLLALLYGMFSCVFVTFPYGILGQVWYLIESIPDLCLLPFIQTEVYYAPNFGAYLVKRMVVRSSVLTSQWLGA